VPTYDYRCRDCGHTIEIVHSILEDGPDACERCRGPLVRVLHPAGVIFKGSGFYVTDSRKTDSRKTDSRKTTGSSDGPGSGSGDGGSTAPKSGSKTTESGGASSSTSSGDGGKGTSAD
jgi:putative FmdB family regulatory protein